MGTVQRERSLVGPVVLIGLGIIFLLNNLRLLDWGVWGTILRLWPLLLIAVGLEFLFGRNSGWGSLVVALVVLGVAAIVVSASGWWVVSGEPFLTSESISQPLDKATSAAIEIEGGVGTLRVEALSGSAETLVEGTVGLRRGEHLQRDFRLTGGQAHLVLKTRGTWGFPFGGRWHGDYSWDLRLNRDIPMSLAIHTGVGFADLDLTAVQLTDLKVGTGVGRTEVTLPASGRIQARLEGGIGETVIFIPNGMAAHIRVEQGIGAVEVPDGYVRADHTYTSSDYDTAANRVDLEVKGGIGKITVRSGLAVIHRPESLKDYEPRIDTD